MKRLFVLVVLGSIIALAGCSSVSVKHDFDPEVDFSKFKTYDWVDAPPDMQMSAEEARVRNSLLDKRIKSAVDGAMAAKGLTHTEENPDFLVIYHVGVQDKVDVTDWGYTYHPYHYYGGWAARDIQVTNYQEGTLVLDFIDAEGMNLAWRGIAQKVLEDAPSPDRVQANLDDIAEKLLAKYPPQ